MNIEAIHHLSVGQLEKHTDHFIDGLIDKKPETRGTYQRALRQFLGWCQMNRGFNFHPTAVERYKKYLTDKKQLSDVSVSTYLTAVRRFCQHLVEQGIIEHNPAKFIEGNKRPSTHSRSALNQDEIIKLLDSIDPSTPRGVRDFAMIKTMLGCGLSEIEMIRANVGDLKRKNGQHVLLVQGKGHNAKDETVAIPPDAKTAMDRYIALRESVTDNQPLFLSAGNKVRGKRMTTRGISERVNYYLKRAGIKRNRSRRLTPCSLRHTAAMMMVDAGATPEEIQRRMRLGSIATAMIYVNQRAKINKA